MSFKIVNLFKTLSLFGTEWSKSQPELMPSSSRVGVFSWKIFSNGSLLHLNRLSVRSDNFCEKISFLFFFGKLLIRLLKSIFQLFIMRFSLLLSDIQSRRMKIIIDHYSLDDTIFYDQKVFRYCQDKSKSYLMKKLTRMSLCCI